MLCFPSIPGLEARTYRIAGERRGRKSLRRSMTRSCIQSSRGRSSHRSMSSCSVSGTTDTLPRSFPEALPGRARAMGGASGSAAECDDLARAASRSPIRSWTPAIETLILTAGADKQPIVDHVRTNGASPNSPYPVARITARERVRSDDR